MQQTVTSEHEHQHRRRVAHFRELMTAASGDLGILLAALSERVKALEAAVERMAERAENAERGKRR